MPEVGNLFSPGKISGPGGELALYHADSAEPVSLTEFCICQNYGGANGILFGHCGSEIILIDLSSVGYNIP